MNKEEIEEDRAIKISIPLLTEKEMEEINNNFNEIVKPISEQFIKEKNLAIAQYIIDKQQKELKQKESILDKVIEKLKEKIEIVEMVIDLCNIDKRIAKYKIEQQKEVKKDLEEILNIIEGEQK